MWNKAGGKERQSFHRRQLEGPRNEVGPLVIGHDPTAAKFETGKVDMEGHLRVAH